MGRKSFSEITGSMSSNDATGIVILGNSSAFAAISV